MKVLVSYYQYISHLVGIGKRQSLTPKVGDKPCFFVGGKRNTIELTERNIHNYPIVHDDPFYQAQGIEPMMVEVDVEELLPPQRITRTDFVRRKAQLIAENSTFGAYPEKVSGELNLSDKTLENANEKICDSCLEKVSGGLELSDKTLENTNEKCLEEVSDKILRKFKAAIDGMSIQTSSQIKGNISYHRNLSTSYDKNPFNTDAKKYDAVIEYYEKTLHDLYVALFKTFKRKEQFTGISTSLKRRFTNQDYVKNLIENIKTIKKTLK